MPNVTAEIRFLDFCLVVVSHQLAEPSEPQHSWHEWMLVESGQHQIRSGRQQWRGQFAEWVLIPAGCRHRPQFLRDGNTSFWLLQWRGGPELGQEMVSGRDSSGRLRSLALWLHGLLPSEQIETGPVYWLANLLVHGSVDAVPAPSDPLDRVLQFIHHNPTAHHSCASLAQWAGMPARSFHRRFTQLTGQTPLRYVQHCRLERALHLLQTSSASLAAIGKQVGIPNARHLGRLMKERYGLGARQLRARAHDEA